MTPQHSLCVGPAPRPAAREEVFVGLDWRGLTWVGWGLECLQCLTWTAWLQPARAWDSARGWVSPAPSPSPGPTFLGQHQVGPLWGFPALRAWTWQPLGVPAPPVCSSCRSRGPRNCSTRTWRSSSIRCDWPSRMP